MGLSVFFVFFLEEEEEIGELVGVVEDGKEVLIGCFAFNADRSSKDEDDFMSDSDDGSVLFTSDEEVVKDGNGLEVVVTIVLEFIVLAISLSV